MINLKISHAILNSILSSHNTVTCNSRVLLIYYTRKGMIYGIHLPPDGNLSLSPVGRTIVYIAPLSRNACSPVLLVHS
jgi:hypothetical protein